MALKNLLKGDGHEPAVRRVLVATDRSETAEQAVAWAAEMAARYEAELVLVQIVVPPNQVDPAVTADLAEHARDLAGSRGRAVVAIHEDPARAIVQAADEQDADVVVVGNVGMSGRKEFLLGNVPNRVSHLTRKTCVIVNTAQRLEQAQRKGWFRR
jgi:nucleotide-binding universal stress UspA family protein